MERSGSELISGCVGEADTNVSYCIKPGLNHLVLYGQDKTPETSFPLNICQGDCDSDDDCAVSL